MDIATIATLVTGLSGIVLAIITWLSKSSSERRDDITKYRQELAARLDRCEQERDAARAKEDEIQRGYYDLMVQYNKLQDKFEYCEKCKHELEEFKKKGG